MDFLEIHIYYWPLSCVLYENCSILQKKNLAFKIYCTAPAGYLPYF